MIESIEELKVRLLEDNANFNEIFRNVSEDVWVNSEILSLMKEKDVKPTLTILSVLKKNITDILFINEQINMSLESFSEEIKKQKSVLIDKIGVEAFYLDQGNKLFSEEVINKLGVDNVALLYKYGYLPELEKKITQISSIDFDKLLESENIDNFMEIYTNILNNDGDEIDIKSFLRAARKYIKSPHIFNEILQDDSLKKELRGKLHEYFLCGYEKLEVSSIDDVKNIETLISKKVDEEIDFANRFLRGKTRSCLIEMLTTKSDGLEFLSKISDEKIQNLSDILSEDDKSKDFENLANLKLFINLSKKINLRPQQAKEFIKAFMEELTEEDRIAIFETYGKAEEDLVKAYERELNESMVSIESVIDNIKNGNLTNSYLEFFCIDESTESVPYLVLRDQSVLIQHVMNAYQKNHKNGKIDLFKNGPGIVTAPILSTSTITNETEQCLENSKRVGAYGQHKIETKHDVTLLFDKVSNGSLVAFGPNDCAIQASQNNLESVTSWTGSSPTSFGTASEIIEKAVVNGEQGTEYVFYQDKGLKPAGIRVMGDTPLKAEFIAAQELGVPLVKIEKAQEIQPKQKIPKDAMPTEKVAIAMEKVDKILERIIQKSQISTGQIGKKTFGWLGDDSFEFEDELFFDEVIFSEDELEEI